jgi:hypothetical protein
VRTDGLPADTIITSPSTNAHRAALVKSTLSIGSVMCDNYAAHEACAVNDIINTVRLSIAKCQPETLNMSQSHLV